MPPAVAAVAGGGADGAAPAAPAANGRGAGGVVQGLIRMAMMWYM